MQALKTWLADPERRFPLLLSVMAVFVLLLARNLGNYPAIFADEYYYSVFTRLTARSEAMLPSYLYYALFGVTRYCGDGFLECARLLNVLALVGAAPFIYLLGRSLMPAFHAAVVTLLAMLAPFNLYTAYFMPETLYFLAFWVFSWAMFRFVAAPNLARAAGVGVVLGLAALIKMHALFWVAPCCAFLTYVAFSGRGTLTRHWVVNAALFCGAAMAAAAAIRFAVGYLLAGKAGLGLLGPFYSAAANRAPLVELLLPALQNLQGHVLGLVLLFAVPLAALLLHGASASARRESGARVGALVVYSVLMLTAMMLITAMFTASVVGHGPSETIGRLHMRYYDFLFPLLLLIGATQLSAPAAVDDQRRRVVIAVALAALVLYARWRLVRDYTPIFIDTPELWSLTKPWLLNLCTLLALATLGYWALARQRGARLYLYLAMPLVMLSSAGILTVLVRTGNTDLDPHARAGAFTRDHLRPEEIDNLTIVTFDHGAAFRTKYFLDSVKANMLVLPPGQAFSVGQLGKQRDWALVIGDYQPPAHAVAQNVNRGFSLFKIGRPDVLLQEIEFSEPDLKLAASSGMFTAEPWGRWSDGKQIVLETATALPQQLRVYLSARAAGPNVDQPFTVRVGTQEQKVRFGADVTHVILDFESTGAERRITIDVPQPVSASTLGANPVDQRQVGLALIRMELAQRAVAVTP